MSLDTIGKVKQRAIDLCLFIETIPKMLNYFIISLDRIEKEKDE